MTITIPPEAVEAAVQAYLSTPGRTASIRAAIRAALAAWPDATILETVPLMSILLPLPQENPDAEA